MGASTTDILASGYVDLSAYGLPTGNYYLPSGKSAFNYTAFSDAQDGFFMPNRMHDALGNVTDISFDAYHLFPVTIVDALSNSTHADIDYRVLQPDTLSDPNQNITALEFDVLGMPVKLALMGKSNLYDSLSSPTTEFTYDVLNYQNNQQPNYSHSKSKVNHGTGNTEFMESYEYSNGMGATIMTKVQAEPEPITNAARWVGSGKTIINNKGKMVMQFEPYFSPTHNFDYNEALAEVGVSPIMYYDPLGRLIKTDLPNRTFSKVEFNAWEQTSYDANDTVQDSAWYTERTSGGALYADLTERDAATKALAHYGTPNIVHLDTLGRAFYSIADNGTAGKYTTQTYFDIEGQETKILDARGNQAFAFSYDLASNRCKQVHHDGGTKYVLLNAMGMPYKMWEATRYFTYSYDALNRPTHTIARDYASTPTTITFQKMEYGETASNALANNLKGKPYKTYDGSGVTEIPAYDFKGNPLSSIKKLVEDYTTAPNWNGTVMLQASGFTTSTTYDALNRPTHITTPDGKITQYEYNQRGLLDTTKINDGGAIQSIVNSVVYNAKGQRTDVYFDNTTKTKYEYNEKTFLLTRILSTRNNGNDIMQDIKYTYDPVGNITQTTDDAQQTIYFNNTVTKPTTDYTYDALYKLVQTQGRENSGNTGYYEETTYDSLGGNNVTSYTRNFEYDAVGNMTKMQHLGTNGFTKHLNYNTANNLLTDYTIGSNTTPYETFTYDSFGNLLSSAGKTLSYNFLNQLTQVDLGGGGMAYYAYDAQGQRTMKVVVATSGALKVRYYIGSYEMYREINSGSTLTLQRETLNIFDDANKVAILDTKDNTSTIRYVYGNNLGSVSLELDADANIISYHEYYPFGGTAYCIKATNTEVANIRYKYCGKEQDDETGMYYYGARYYLPWLCRFASVDPKALKYVFQSSYAYAENNPVKYVDVNGEGAGYNGQEEVKTKKEVEKNKNNANLKERTNFLGEQGKDFGFASPAQIEMARKNKGFSGNMKVYWNPNAVGLSGKKGDYFFQKPVQQFNEQAVNQPLNLPNPNPSGFQNINQAPISFNAGRSTFNPANAATTNNFLLNLGSNNLPSDITNIAGSAVRLAPVTNVTGNNSAGFPIVQTTFTTQQPATRTVTNFTINVGIRTNFLRTDITPEGRAPILMNNRFSTIANQIARSGFPFGNVVNQPTLFNQGIGGSGNMVNIQVGQQSGSTAGFIINRVIQTRQFTYGE